VDALVWPALEHRPFFDIGVGEIVDLLAELSDYLRQPPTSARASAGGGDRWSATTFAEPARLSASTTTRSAALGE
jgi:hypothetical protein